MFRETFSDLNDVIVANGEFINKTGCADYTVLLVDIVEDLQRLLNKIRDLSNE